MVAGTGKSDLGEEKNFIILRYRQGGSDPYVASGDIVASGRRTSLFRVTNDRALVYHELSDSSCLSAKSADPKGPALFSFRGHADGTPVSSQREFIVVQDDEPFGRTRAGRLPMVADPGPNSNARMTPAPGEKAMGFGAAVDSFGKARALRPAGSPWFRTS